MGPATHIRFRDSDPIWAFRIHHHPNSYNGYKLTPYFGVLMLNLNFTTFNPPPPNAICVVTFSLFSVAGLMPFYLFYRTVVNLWWDGRNHETEGSHVSFLHLGSIEHLYKYIDAVLLLTVCIIN